jgi:hypothetical protein
MTFIIQYQLIRGDASGFVIASEATCNVRAKLTCRLAQARLFARIRSVNRLKR